MCGRWHGGSQVGPYPMLTHPILSYAMLCYPPYPTFPVLNYPTLLYGNMNNNILYFTISSILDSTTTHQALLQIIFTFVYLMPYSPRSPHLSSCRVIVSCFSLSCRYATTNKQSGVEKLSCLCSSHTERNADQISSCQRTGWSLWQFLFFFFFFLLLIVIVFNATRRRGCCCWWW